MGPPESGCLVWISQEVHTAAPQKTGGVTQRNQCGSLTFMASAPNFLVQDPSRLVREPAEINCLL